MTPCIIEIKHVWNDVDMIKNVAVWNFEIGNVPRDVCIEVLYRICCLTFGDYCNVIVDKGRIKLYPIRNYQDVICLRVLNMYSSSCVLFGQWVDFKREIESCFVVEDDFA